MTEKITMILGRESPEAQLARPLIKKATMLSAGAIRELSAIHDELEELRQRTQTTLAEAKEEAQAIADAAREQGRHEGLKEVMEQLARARAEYRRLQSDAEQDMVALAFHVAHRIIGHAVEVNPEVIRDIVGQALISARGKKDIVVWVHPEDYAQLEPQRAQFARELDGVPVHFKADPEVERGGCAIDTESGRIDARLTTQLEVLREALMQG